jgi:hypothetical protein
MIQAELRTLAAASTRALRHFGWLIGGIFLALGVYCLVRGFAAGPWFAGLGALLVVLGTFTPRSLRPVYIVWMALGLLLGVVVTHVILTLFFFLVVTPLGLLQRAFGRDPLERRLDPGASTYWIARPSKPAQPADYELQY